MPVYARDGGLSRDNLIIAASCGVVGGLILLAGLARCIQLACQRSRSRQVPLPPPQPLAHHRLRKETMVSARIASAYSVSDADLLSPTFPSRHASLMPSESGASSADDVSLYQPPLDAADGTLLPHPPFSPGPGSSLGSDMDAPPSPSSMHSTMHRPRVMSHHARPMSTASGSTAFSRTSRTLGARGSQIQIVLPAPLAPGAYPADFRGSMYAASDVSIADKWVPAPHRHDGIETGRQSSSSVGSLSTLSTASHLAPSFSYYSTSSPPTSRSPSNSRRSPSRSRSPGPSSLATSITPSMSPSQSPEPPPVPRVPSMYARSGTYPPPTIVEGQQGLPDGGPRRAAAAPPGSDVGLSQV